MRLPSDCRILCVGLILSAVAPAPARAAGLRSALAGAAQALGRSTDEVARDAGRALGQLAKRDEAFVEAAGRAMSRGRGGKVLGKADVAEALKHLGLDEAGPDLARHLDGLDTVGKEALVELAAQSRRAIEVGRAGSLGPDAVLGALDRGGPEALTVLRGMPDDDAARLCLEGFARHGEPFADFARRGDAGAVRWLARHGDELEPDALRKVLREPTKYLDEAGNLKPAGRALLPGPADGAKASRRLGPAAGKAAFRVGAVATISATAWNFPGRLIDRVERTIGGPAADFLRRIKWPLTLAGLLLLGVLALWALPKLARPAAWLAARALPRVAVVLPARARERSGRAAAWGRRRLTAGRLVPAAAHRRGRLTLGVLGLERVGKSTFLVMLNKTLSRVVPGASCEPRTRNRDLPVFREMIEEVAWCRPTVQERDLDLNLTWPTNEVGTGGTHVVGIKDAPGEWARLTAPPGDFGKLVGFLREVDGLFVVIDPTGLEGDGARRRLELQRDSLKGMFSEDGVDLGGNFLRSMVLVVTKRDLIDRATLDRLAARPDFDRAGEVDRMAELAARPALTPGESRELGVWIVDAMFPGLREAWGERLRIADPGGTWRTGWARWFARSSRPRLEAAVRGPTLLSPLRWFARSSRPRLEVFAVSLLGPTLGGQVRAYREDVRRWEAGGEAGPRPEMAEPLDFDAVDARELDYHNAVGWMLDELPAGLIHQANGLRGFRGLLYRLSIYLRFPQAPRVRADRATSLWRLVRGFAIVSVLLLVGWWGLDRADRRFEEEQVKGLFADAARSGGTPGDFASQRQRLEACLRLPSRPLTRDLNYFSDMLANREVMAGLAGDFHRAPLAEGRFQAGLAWLRRYSGLLPLDPSWARTLGDYRISFDNQEFNDILGGTVEAAEKVADPEGQDLAGLDRIEARIAGCRRALPSIGVVTAPNYPGTWQRLDERLAKLDRRIAEARSDRRLAEATGRARKLVDPKLADSGFPAAIAAVDEYLRRGEAGDPPRGGWLEKGRGERGGLVERFRAWAEIRFREARRAGEFKKIEDLATELKGACDPADEKALRLVRDTLDDLSVGRVEYATRLAEKDIDAGDEPALMRAEKLLKDASGSVQDVLEKKGNKPVAAKWFDATIRSMVKGKRFSEAIDFLAEPAALKGADLLKGREAETWVQWADSLDADIPPLLDDPAHNGEATPMLEKFLSKSQGRESARDARAKVEELVLARTLPAKVRAAIEVSKRRLAARDPDAALDAARRVEGEAARLLADPAANGREIRLVEEWLEATVAAYKALGRHPDAIKFLDAFAGRDGGRSLKPRDENALWRDHAAWLLGALDRAEAGEREGVWSRLAGAGRDHKDRKAFVDAIQSGAAERIKKLIDGAEAAADQAGKDPRKASSALDKVKGAEGELGDWLTTNLGGGPPRQRLDRLEARLRGALIQEGYEALVERIEKIKLESQYGPVLKDLDARIDGVHDDERRRFTALRDDLLKGWEGRAYGDLKGAAADRNFDVLEERLTRYLSKSSPFRDKVPGDRAGRARKVLDWLKDFEEPRTYVVTAIRARGFDTAQAGWDPAIAVRVRNAGGGVTEIRAQGYNPAREFRLGADDADRPFSTPREFRWRKGDAIEIGLWHRDFERPKYCFGVAKVADGYSLPRLALPGRFVSARPQDRDFKADPGFVNLEVGLDVQRSDAGQGPFGMPSLAGDE